MSNTKLASTGSKDLDKNVDRTVIVIEDHGPVELPGAAPIQSVIFQGTHYGHVAEDADGRWIYRRL